VPFTGVFDHGPGRCRASVDRASMSIVVVLQSNPFRDELVEIEARGEQELPLVGQPIHARFGAHRDCRRERQASRAAEVKASASQRDSLVEPLGAKRRSTHFAGFVAKWSINEFHRSGMLV
jgi:hypothetical protein